MIKNLKGTHETVTYSTDVPLCLYHNNTPENFPPHWHLPFELIMPLKNNYLVINNQKEFTLHENDILIIFPGTIHELKAPANGERLIFQTTLPSDVNKNIENLMVLLGPLVLITPESHPEIHPQILHLVKLIKLEYDKKSLYFETLIYSYFFEILVILGRNHVNMASKNMTPKGNKQQEYIMRFLSITDYINQHFTENLSLDQIASMAGFSKYHFSRLFHKYTGTSFYRYLNIKRISYSQTLLLNPELTITEISYQSGFPTLSAFMRMFRLINNCTPNEFRSLRDIPVEHT